MTSASDLIIRIQADLAPLLASLAQAERVVAASGGKIGGAAGRAEGALSSLAQAGLDLQRALQQGLGGFDATKAIERAIGTDVWAQLGREAERDYQAFWTRITNEQDRRQTSLAGRAQGVVRDLTGQRYLGPLANEVVSDYENLWADLLDERDAAQAKIIRHNEDLRAGFDPLFAAQLTYRRRLEEIDDALSRNAIDEDTAARARKAATITHEQQAKALDRSAFSMGKAALAAGALYATVSGLALLASMGRQVVEVTAKFDGLEGSLKTVTGSAMAAQGVFSVIQDFAARTPYSVEEATRAFIALKARGLDPSMGALRDYGNTASSMSAGLMDMVEAVADAVTGEFDSLKKFGIDAQAQGDKVIFTFKGVSTEVKKNATDIEGYLRRLGQVDFAGAMEEQAARVNGALSNMGDAYDGMLSRIGKSLPIRMVATGFATIFDWVGDKFETTLDEQIATLSARADDMSREMDAVQKRVQDAFAAGADPDSMGIRADMELIKGMRARIAEVSGELIKLRSLQKQQKDAAEEAQKPGKRGETPDEKRVRLIREQLDALRTGGPEAMKAVVRAQKEAEGGMEAILSQMDKLRDDKASANLVAQMEALRTGGVKAWEDITLQQKEAEGGQAALQARLDKLKGDLSKADGLKTPWEKWPQQLAELTEMLDQGLISLSAFTAAVKDQSPVEHLKQFVADTVNDAALKSQSKQLVDDFQVRLQADLDKAMAKGDVGDALRKPVESALNRAAQSAADAAGNIMTRIQAGDWGSVAEGIGVFQDRLRDVQAQGLSAGDALMEVGKALLDSAEAGNGFANLLGKMFGRDKDQNKNAQIGGAIGSTVGQFLPGGKAVWAAVGNLIGGAFGGNSVEDALNQKLTAERDALAKSINTFLSAGKEMSETASRTRALREQFGQLRAEAERLGQPLDEITRSYQRQLKAIQDDLKDSLQDILDRAEGRDALADFRALMKEQGQRIDDALMAEVDLSMVRRTNAAQLTAFFKNLSADQIALFEGVARQVDILQAKVSSMTAGISSQLDESIGLYEDLAANVKAEADTLRGLVKTLRQTIEGWDIGTDSALGLDKQMEIAAKRFQDMVAKANTGDKDAIGGLSDLASTYRDIARQYYGSSEAFFAVEDSIKAALAQVATTTDARATGLEQMASIALVQVELLGDLKALLAADLGKPTADMIAAALADGKLTIGEATGITNALSDLGDKVAGATGPAAKAAQDAIDTLKTEISTGNIAGIGPALTDLQDALTGFKSTQIEEYQKALGAAADTLTAVQEWVLDPDGKIPAAVAAAFAGGWFDQTLNTRIENTFRAAIGMTPLPLPATGQLTDLVGKAIGDGATGSSATARMEKLIADSIASPSGGWSPANTLKSLINSQFGQAISIWGDVPLTTRVNQIFAQALGADSGSTWQGTLKQVLDAGSPLLTALGDLRTALADLVNAMKTDSATGAAQTAYDQAMQAFVTPISQGAGAAWSSIAGAKDVESAKKMTNTVLTLDSSTGAELARGGKDSSADSDARAQALASGLSGLAKLVESLTGGQLADTFQVNASDKYGSGYWIGNANRLQSFGINDFEGIARAFFGDALSSLSGADPRIVEVLKNADLSDMQAGLTKAAREVYAVLHPPAFAAGGLHAGGLRLVGENGPELEVTGPARYFSAPQTAAMLSASRGGVDSADQVAELKQINANLVRVVAVQAAGIDQMSARLDRMAAEFSTLSSRIDPDLRVA